MLIKFFYVFVVEQTKADVEKRISVSAALLLTSACLDLQLWEGCVSMATNHQASRIVVTETYGSLSCVMEESLTASHVKPEHLLGFFLAPSAQKQT